jgi:competence protein ComEA
MLSSSQKKIVLLISLVLVIGIAISIYKVYFHPLSKEYLEIEKNQLPIPEIKSQITTSNKQIKAPPRHLYIHIAGAVKNPGIYEVEPDLRVIDALKLAGPILAEADLDKINLVAKVKDGKRLYVPFNKELVKALKKQKKLQEKEQKELKKNREDNFKIDLNKASFEELIQIPSLSKNVAEGIIEYRKERGSINNINELLNIKGVGPKTLEKIKKYLL